MENQKSSSNEIFNKNRTLPDFKELDNIKLRYRSDKYESIKKYNKIHNTTYRYFSEIIYDLFTNKDKTPAEIGKIFGNIKGGVELTAVGVRYHLKYKMGLKMLQHGGCRFVPSKSGIPGIYPSKIIGRYLVFLYNGSEKIYSGTYNNLFIAAWERRVLEIKYGFTKKSLAQEFINKNWRNLGKFRDIKPPKCGGYDQRFKKRMEKKADSKFY